MMIHKLFFLYLNINDEFSSIYNINILPNDDETIPSSNGINVADDSSGGID
jgi:hypothetical protein